MGETNALKMDQYLYAALCDGAAPGATVTLAGAMKDASFKGEGIQDDLLEGESQRGSEPDISEWGLKALTV